MCEREGREILVACHVLDCVRGRVNLLLIYMNPTTGDRYHRLASIGVSDKESPKTGCVQSFFMLFSSPEHPLCDPMPRTKLHI